MEENKKLKFPVESILLWGYSAYGLIHLFRFFSIFNLIDTILLVFIGFFAFRSSRKLLFGTIAAKTLIRVIAIICYKSFYLNSILAVLPYVLVLLYLAVSVFPLSEQYISIAKKLRFIPAVLQFVLAIVFHIEFFFEIFDYFLDLFHPDIILYYEIPMLMDIVLAVAFYFLVDRALDPYKSITIPSNAVRDENGQILVNNQNEEYVEIYCEMVKHILLCVFTCGIWYMIWIYKATRYLNRSPSGEQYDPTNKLLLCLFVPFYQIYWFYKHGQKLDSLMKARKIGSSDMGTLCLILGIFLPIVACILMQDKFNQLCMATEKTENASVEAVKKVEQKPESGNMEMSTIENLTKYKELLDSGVITQEEFDAKKKQLLGL